MCLIFRALPEKSNTFSFKYASEASNRSEFMFMSNDGVNFFGLLTYDFLSKMDFREKNLQQVLNLLQVVS
jgi:hypothetical protein